MMHFKIISLFIFSVLARPNHSQHTPQVRPLDTQEMEERLQLEWIPMPVYEAYHELITTKEGLEFTFRHLDLYLTFPFTNEAKQNAVHKTLEGASQFIQQLRIILNSEELKDLGLDPLQKNVEMALKTPASPEANKVKENISRQLMKIQSQMWSMALLKDPKLKMMWNDYQSAMNASQNATAK